MLAAILDFLNCPKISRWYPPVMHYWGWNEVESIKKKLYPSVQGIPLWLPDYKEPSLVITYIFVLGCYTLDDGFSYQGSVNKTLNGFQCQRWSWQTPHNHMYKSPIYYPDDTVANAGSFCRNTEHAGVWPWCYTTDPSKRWEYCYLEDSISCGE